MASVHLVKRFGEKVEQDELSWSEGYGCTVIGLASVIGVTHSSSTIKGFVILPPQKRGVNLSVDYLVAEAGKLPWEIYCPVPQVLGNNPEQQMQIPRLTTPKLKNVWGPVRSG